MQNELTITEKNLEVFFLNIPENLALQSLTKVFQDFLEAEMKIKIPSSLSIELCSEAKIQELNSNYREKDKITDVLSFPIQDDIRNGEFDKFSPELEIGDIVICEEVCQRQAREHSIDFSDEFYHLAIHGFLHVCGYDHEISLEEENLMEGLEKKLLEDLSNMLNKKA